LGGSSTIWIIELEGFINDGENTFAFGVGMTQHNHPLIEWISVLVA
jgi:hypothetical protein